MKTSIAIVAVAIGLSSTAAADEPVPGKARTLAQQGREFHDKGDYVSAIAAFKEAYVIAPSPALLFNLAQAYRLQGNCEDAALMYRRYLGTGPDPDGRQMAEGHLNTVERCVSKRSMNIPMDEGAKYLNLPAPPADLGVVDAPKQVDKPSSSRGGRVKKTVGVSVAIGGGAALAAATYFGLRARSASSEVERLYAEGAKWDQIEPVDDRGKRSATYAKVLGISGGVAAAAGVTLYVLGRRDERATQLAFVPTTTGAEVSYAWQF
ncbi:MAG: tetratricopeptide repeat protein [Kofleriaceae bacterium]